MKAVIRYVLLTIATLIFSTSAIAKTGLGDDNEKWRQTIERVVKNGQVLESQFGTYVYLEEMTPNDRKQDHISNYLAAVGGFDSQNVFGVGHIEAVYENWTTNADGHWNVDQMTFKLTVEGELQRFSKYHMVQTKVGIVLQHDAQSFSQEEALAAWQKLKTNWMNPTLLSKSSRPSETEQWQKLLEKIVNSQESIDTPIGLYLSLSDITPNDITKNRTAHYISAVGGYSAPHVFDIKFLDAVSEKWTQLENGDWHLDQWTFRVSTDGEMLVGRHNNVIKSNDYSRRKSETLTTDAATLQAKWLEIKSYWHSFR